jgi:hypothetical protein
MISVFESLFVFGLIVFLYVVGVSYWQPDWLHKQVSHLQEGIWWLSWLRNDVMGVIGFLASGASFFAFCYLKNSDAEREAAHKAKDKALSKKEKPVKLVELYTVAGQYYATVLIAVVLAQLSVLTFLQGKYDIAGNSETLSIGILITIYFLTLIAGWYFGDRFLKFSELLDQTIANSQFDPTVQRLARDIGKSHFNLRQKIVTCRPFVLSAYVVASLVGLAAVLYI